MALPCSHNCSAFQCSTSLINCCRPNDPNKTRLCTSVLFVRVVFATEITKFFDDRENYHFENNSESTVLTNKEGGRRT